MTVFVLLLVAFIFIMNGGMSLPVEDTTSIYTVTDDYGRKEYRKLDCPYAERTEAFSETDRKKCLKWAQKKARKRGQNAYEEAKDRAEEALMDGFRRGSQGNPFSHIREEGEN